MERNLHIMGLNGDILCNVTARSGESIRSVKVAIQAATQIRPSEQRLILGGAELTDETPLCSGALLSGNSETITLVRRPLLQAQWMERVEKDGRLLREAPPEITADREVVLLAVQQYWASLESACAELRADREIVTIALQQSAYALRFASGELQADHKIVTIAVHQQGYALQYASADLRADRDVVMAAIGSDRAAFKFAAVQLYADREFVLTILRRDWRVLQFAPEVVRADREFVRAAVMQYGGALEWAAPELRADRALVEQALRHDLVALEYVSNDLLADGSFILAAMQVYVGALVYAASELLEDADFICAAELQNNAARRCIAMINSERARPTSWAINCRDSRVAVDGDANVCENFDDCGLVDTLLRGIYLYGLEKPSPIQQHGIKPIISGHDMIAQAGSGTGKTLTHIIGVLQLVDTAKRVIQALVFVRTQERALKIQKAMAALGSLQEVEWYALTSHEDLLDRHHDGQHVLVGTPGLVFDFVRAGRVIMDNLKIIVVDRADEMMTCRSTGIHDVFKLLPANTQVCVFTSTMPSELLQFTRRHMCDPVRILVTRSELTLEGLRQFYVNVEREEWKLDTCCDLFESLTITQAVIYCNTRRKVHFLADQCSKRDLGVSIEIMYPELEQKERDLVTCRFRTGACRFIIASDMSQSFFDVSRSPPSLVIHYDYPHVMENYLNRVGRSGKFGRKTVSIVFLTQSDMDSLRELQSFYNTRIDELPMDVADLL